MRIRSGENKQTDSSLIKLARLFNNFYFDGFLEGRCKPLFCRAHQIGLVKPDVEDAIKPFEDVFKVSQDRIDILHSQGSQDEDIYEEVSNKLDVVLRTLRDSSNHDFVALKGWRDENYEIKNRFSDKSLFRMERSATCMFGMHQYGVDINGYVNHPEKGLCVWLQKRSSSKPTWPGRWDNFVSGGLSVGHSVHETVIKEAGEEANVPDSLVSSLRPAGCVSFFFESERGIFPQTEFVFDLELPLDFVPKNNDGEVEEFALVPAKDLAAKICQPDMKTTSTPITVDFLIRMGIINTENEPDYLELVELCHVPLQSIYSRGVMSPGPGTGESWDENNHSSN